MMSKKNLFVKTAMTVLGGVMLAGMLTGCGAGHKTYGGLKSEMTTDLSSLGLFEGDEVCKAGWYDYYTLTPDDKAMLKKYEDEGVYLEERGVNDAREIYDSITYNEKMFYGKYLVNHSGKSKYSKYSYILDPSDGFIDTTGWRDSAEVFSTNVEDYKYDYDAKYISDKDISVLPYSICAGIGSLGDEYDDGDLGKIVNDSTHEYMMLTYAVKARDREYYAYEKALATYEVSGNTLTVTYLDAWSYDADNNKTSIKISDRTESFEFSFSGIYLTLSNGKESVTMCNYGFCDRSYMCATVDGKINMGEKPIDDFIFQIKFSQYAKKKDGKPRFVVGLFKEPTAISNIDVSEYVYNDSKMAVARYDQDGLFSFAYIGLDGKVKQHKYVAFMCYNDGIILADKENVYYYTSSFDARYNTEDITYDFGSNVAKEDEAAFAELDDSAIEFIQETRRNLLADLKNAFKREGVDANVDEVSGEITLNSEILFKTNEYAISSDGEKTLAAFIGCFAEVLDKDEYDDFIKEILIQGHTDTDGDYDYNLELSQKRADAVMKFCLNDAGLADEQAANMEALMLAQGCSYDYPVYDADGNVDMAASRRVTFTFHINVNYRG